MSEEAAEIERVGVVLAGGRGRRFGRPKATVEIGGVTLVERAVGLLQRFCPEVLVAARPEIQLPPLGVAVIHDPEGEPSALTGLCSGLRASRGAQVVVVACDLLVAPALVERLLEAPGSAAVAADGNGPQPLCGRYPRDRALAACQRLLDEGDLRARRIADLVGATIVTAQQGELRNVNTWPDAYAATLEVDPLSEEAIELILDLTRVVAHGTERVNGPVASFLAGMAAARAAAPIEAWLRDAIAAAKRLLEEADSG